MLRVVLDVNVFLSALIARLGIPHRLWLAWRQERFILIGSEHIISTTVAKLRLPRIARRYPVAEEDVTDFEGLLRQRAIIVPVQAEDILPITGDPEDDTVLATARLGEADYLVTGDRGLLALGSYERTRIVTPRQFFDMLGM